MFFSLSWNQYNYIISISSNDTLLIYYSVVDKYKALNIQHNHVRTLNCGISCACEGTTEGRS